MWLDTVLHHGSQSDIETIDLQLKAKKLVRKVNTSTLTLLEGQKTQRNEHVGQAPLHYVFGHITEIRVLFPEDYSSRQISLCHFH